MSGREITPSGLGTTKGFLEKLVTNPIEVIEDKAKSISKVRIDVWNHTGRPFKAVMNSNREVRTIAPGGKATFAASS